MTVPDDAADGGTLTVMTAVAPTTLDPTQAYFTDSTAILSDLVTRSLTQYAYNANGELDSVTNADVPLQPSSTMSGDVGVFSVASLRPHA